MKWKKRLLEIQRLQAKHGLDRSMARQFPDLSVPKLTARTSDRIDKLPPLNREEIRPELGEQFVVSHLHKSGYQVLLKSEAPFFGKKP